MRLGEYDLSHEIDCSDEEDPDSCAPPYQDIAVAKFMFHVDYNDKVISSSDIGIVQLMTAYVVNSKCCVKDPISRIVYQLFNFRKCSTNLSAIQ